MDGVKILVIFVFVAIVGSLANALFHLYRGDTGPQMVRALTVRIALSMVLFLLLLLAWRVGLITPHGLARH
jgi:hypothetical protein